MFLFRTGLHCGTTTKNQWPVERSYEQPELTNTVKIQSQPSRQQEKIVYLKFVYKRKIRKLLKNQCKQQLKKARIAARCADSARKSAKVQKSQD